MPEMLSVLPKELVEKLMTEDGINMNIEEQAKELEEGKTEEITDQSDNQIASEDLERAERMVDGMVELETHEEKEIERKPELEQMSRRTDQSKAEPKVGKVEQALDVLRRLVGPFDDLYDQAGEEVAQVKALEQTKQENKAASLAWGLVRKYTKSAAPRYYESAAKILETIKKNPFYAEVATECEELFDEANLDMAYEDWKNAIGKCRQIYAICKKAINSPEAIKHFTVERDQKEANKRQRHAQNKEQKRQENRERTLRGKSNSKK